MQKLLVSSLVLSASIAVAGPAPVVGGTTSKAGAWPDVVAVLGTDAACTGTLVAPDVVITAGHCAVLPPVEVIVNTTDFGRAGGETIRVAKSIPYPSWETTYDVGVLVLEHAASVAPRAVARACSGHTLDNPVRIVGFGLTDTDGIGDNTRLHEASIGVDDPRCTEAPGCNPDVAPDGEFTAGGHGTDSCFGDSGGPAFADTIRGPALIGIVSRGMTLPGRPCGNGGIYVRADKVAPWVEQVTGRKLARAACDRPADDSDPAAEPSGGCSATPVSTGVLPMLPLFVTATWRRRRRVTTRA